ncbi:ribonuclease T2 [Sardina pilchardus]|uniref:ribonuclease T2 n=1 Tax=Sardina pilchardus TaxID=27697 RepID=UPI002E0ED4D2
MISSGKTGFEMKAIAFVTLLFLACGLATPFYLKPWSEVTLTLHWPQTFCNMEHCSPHLDYWTLHGLWPNAGMNCNNTWKFNISEVQDLKADMEKYWPNLLHPTSIQFWSYEWHKHGTCAASVESLNSQHKYFSKALELYKRFDLTKTLKNAGIEPSEQNYQFDDIERCIWQHFGAQPKIQCVKSTKGENVQELGQVEICLNTDFMPVACKKSKEDLWSRVNELLLNRFSAPSPFQVCDFGTPVHYPMVKENKTGH